jgi:GT2 family glycosyltransferase
MVNGKKIGIVILNYNDAESVEKLLATIYPYTSIDHIVIVDNLSPDESFKILKRLANEKVDVIQTDRNGGYSYGNNYGAYHLMDNYHSDILFIANPDVEFDENFLIQIVNDMGKYEAQAATGYMLMPSLPRLVMNTKINGYWQELIDCTLFLHRFIHFQKDSVIKNRGVIPVEWLPGSLFAIDAKAYKLLHGLDDRVFLYYEEQMLGEKFKQAGYKMIVDTDVDYFHNHSVSIDKSIKQISQLKQRYKSKYFFFTRYKHIGYLQRGLLKIFMYYGITMRKFLYPIKEIIS